MAYQKQTFINNETVLTAEMLDYIEQGIVDNETAIGNKQNKGDYALKSELPTKTSELANDSGYLKSYTETDPTVPTWAKASSKPTYTKSEVGLGNVDNVKQYSASNPPPYPVTSVNGKVGAITVDVPTALSQLTEDSTHRVVTDAEKTTWNNKSNFSGSYNDLTNKPAIPTVPTKVSAFTNDAGYQTAAQVQEYAQPKGDYATTSDVNNLQEQIYNTLDEDDVSIEVTDTGSKLTIGSKTVNIENGKDGTIQIPPLFAESVDWLEENGDTSKVYILPNNLIYAYMYTEGEAPSYTNWLPLATDTDRVTVFNGTGYKNGYRLNSSGVQTACTGMMVTGFIPCKKGDIIRIKGAKDTTSTYGQNLCFYNSANGYLGLTVGTKTLGNFTADGCSTETDSEGNITVTVDTSAVASASAIGDCDAFRFACGDFSNAIITVNEDISGSGGTAAGYKWASTGHSFIPTDYEERIIELEKKASGASSIQTYLNARKTYIAPVPSGYCESKNEYIDYSVKVAEAIDFATMTANFSALATANPDYITETLLGKDASGTYNIYKYELDLKPAVSEGYTSVMNTDKPVFIITSGLHGNEKDPVHEVYHFMKDLCDNWVESDHLEYLRTNVKFVIVPIANPWGFVNHTYNNSNDVNLNKNFEHGFSQVDGGTGSQQNTGANAYSEAETVLLKGVFDSYPKAIFHLECHGKVAHDTTWNNIIWFSLMKSLKSELVEICSNTVIHQIGRRLYKMGFETGKSEGGYITYYTLNGRPKDYTATEYGMLSCTMEGTGRMSVAGHTTYTKYEQQINAEALENFILRVLDALNSRVEI